MELTRQNQEVVEESTHQNQKMVVLASRMDLLQSLEVVQMIQLSHQPDCQLYLLRQNQLKTQHKAQALPQLLFQPLCLRSSLPFLHLPQSTRQGQGSLGQENLEVEATSQDQENQEEEAMNQVQGSLAQESQGQDNLAAMNQVQASQTEAVMSRDQENLIVAAMNQGQENQMLGEMGQGN